LRKKVRISDVARLSGVSLSTVSLVLNNRPGVSEETRITVIKAANELGYSSLGNGGRSPAAQLQTIGMVIKTHVNMIPQANPFYSKVMMGIEDTCRNKGIQLLFSTIPVDENNQPVEMPALLNNLPLDGLLLVGAYVNPVFGAHLLQRRIPTVLVDGYSENQDFDSVLSDNFRAAYHAIEYLLDKGHRHIGLVGSDDLSFPSLRERRNGYLRALKERDIPDSYIASFNINQTHGFKETTDLLRQNPHITALFCVNDDIASSSLRAAQSLGLKVPDDLSIIGYDDTYLAANTHPALTTLHVDTLSMGRAAVRLLSMRIENPASARMTLLTHPQLIERESVASKT
jgi:LacI family transcriptional regulator